MPLQGAGQSPQESFFVMYLSTSPPSSFQLLVLSGKSLAATPVQFLIGASPFSTLIATAPVVPRSLHSWRIAATGASTFMPRRVIIRYIQPRWRLGLAMKTMKRAAGESALRYSAVTPLHSSRKRFGSAIGTSPVPPTTIAFRFFEP